MNSSTLIINIIRFILLLLLQVMLFKRIHLDWWGVQYLNILVYPLFIMLLPTNISRIAVLAAAFAMGLGIDMFYDSPGLHASASLFSAYIRPFFLHQLAPKNGYKANFSPTIQEMNMNWFLRYSSLMLSAHLLWYFSMEVFTPVYILEILLKTAGGFISSMGFILILMAIFNPKE